MPRRKVRKARTQPPVILFVEGEPVTLHKGTGQGYVRLPDEKGRRKVHYVGLLYLDPDRKTVNQDAVDRAARLIREARILGAAPARDELTVQELADRFIEHALTYYGAGSGEAGIFGYALRHVLALYGSLPAKEFSPLKLKAARDRVVERETWTRKTVNEYVQRVRRVFRWGASNELVPSETYQSLQAVEGLRKGRTTAREPGKVRPAPCDHVEAVLKTLPLPVAAMVRLQVLTGMRPGEVVIMRPSDIDRSGDVWSYQPGQHKSAHLDHERIVDLGPRAQAILAPFLLGRAPDPFCFSPKDAMREFLRARHAARRTPPSHGNRPGTNRKTNPRLQPGDRYAVASYRRAIARACDNLEIPRWSQRKRKSPSGMTPGGS